MFKKQRFSSYMSWVGQFVNVVDFVSDWKYFEIRDVFKEGWGIISDVLFNF